jgi:hypothetical protein
MIGGVIRRNRGESRCITTREEVKIMRLRFATALLIGSIALMPTATFSKQADKEIRKDQKERDKEFGEWLKSQGKAEKAWAKATDKERKEYEKYLKKAHKHGYRP